MKKIFFILSLITILPCLSWGQANTTTLTSYGSNSGTSGSYGAYFGPHSGYSCSGNYNSFFGYYSGYLTTTGTCNTFMGYDCGVNNTKGNYNVFMGNLTGANNLTGGYNTIIGADAGMTNTIGYYNTFLGSFSGYKNLSGVGNTFLGYSSGYKNTGNYNVYVGRYAGYQNTGSSNIFIGNYAGYYETAASNLLYIENSTNTTPLIYGNFSTNQVGINIQGDSLELSSATLGVNGTIAATEVIVAKVASWPDFVFNKDYKLNTLSEVEAFVKKNNHLPDVPSAAEVEKNGQSLGEMNKVLLQKVEELTLYIIEQQKEINAIKEQLNNVQK